MSYLGYEKIISEIKNNKKVMRYIFLIFGLFLSALSYNLFFVPSKIVVGGVSGLAIIFERFGINVSIFILVSNIILLILNYFLLGYDSTIKSIIGSLLFPIFTMLTQDISSFIHFENVDLLMLTVFGSILSGIAGGLIFKVGYNSGGADILVNIVNKYFKVSIGKANLIINIIIILMSGFVFGVNNMFYAIIALYIMSLLNDKILLGIDDNKTVFIITEKERDIKNFIMKKLEHGVTVIDSHGAFTNKKRNILLLVIPSREYFILKEAIHLIDKNAFFVVIDSYQAFYGIE